MESTDHEKTLNNKKIRIIGLEVRKPWEKECTEYHDAFEGLNVLNSCVYDANFVFICQNATEEITRIEIHRDFNSLYLQVPSEEKSTLNDKKIRVIGLEVRKPWEKECTEYHDAFEGLNVLNSCAYDANFVFICQNATEEITRIEIHRDFNSLYLQVPSEEKSTEI